MDLILIGIILATVIGIYFAHNPMEHGSKFIFRRFVNWFPLGMSYAFLYMARYNLNISKTAFGADMTKEDFGIIFGIGTFTYGLSFLLNGPLVDKMGGKKGIIIATLGSSIMNVLMGLATYMYLKQKIEMNLVVVFSILYGMNMFFQSYGAVSIIKVKSYWFHVRERGVFGAIFGTLISFGVYFAFDWGNAIVEASKASGGSGTLHRLFEVMFGVGVGGTDAIWLVFFIPSFFLIIWALLDMWLIKDTPGEANFEDFDTHDASSGEMDREYTIPQLLHKIFTHPVMLSVAFIEFTSGVMRNGIIQWYFIFAKEIAQPGAEIFIKHWGLLLALAGIVGGFAGGFISDRIFHSRRGPAAAIMSGIMLLCAITMAITLKTSPVTVGVCCLIISMAVIGVHSLMSGTAAADFGGRKATATASGITDGFVYLGSGLQSVSLGFLTTQDWIYWPLFLIPFAGVGMILSIRMWHQLPEATRRYLESVELVKKQEKEKKKAGAAPTGLSMSPVRIDD